MVSQVSSASPLPQHGAATPPHRAPAPASTPAPVTTPSPTRAPVPLLGPQSAPVPQQQQQRAAAGVPALVIVDTANVGTRDSDGVLDWERVASVIEYYSLRQIRVGTLLSPQASLTPSLPPSRSAGQPLPAWLLITCSILAHRQRRPSAAGKPSPTHMTAQLNHLLSSRRPAVAVTKDTTLARCPLPYDDTTVPYWSGDALALASLSSLIQENLVGSRHSRGAANLDADDVAVVVLAKERHCPFVSNDKYNWAHGANSELRRWISRNEGLRIEFSFLDRRFLPHKAHPAESPALPPPPRPAPPALKPAPAPALKPAPAPAAPQPALPPAAQQPRSVPPPLAISFFESSLRHPEAQRTLFPPGSDGGADAAAEAAARAEVEVRLEEQEALFTSGREHISIFYRRFRPVPLDGGDASAEAAREDDATMQLDLIAGSLRGATVADLEWLVAEGERAPEGGSVLLYGLDGAPLADGTAPLWGALFGAREARVAANHQRHVS